MRVPKVSVVGGTSEEDPLDFEVDEDASAFLQLPMDGVPVVVTLRQVRVSGASQFCCYA